MATPRRWWRWEDEGTAAARFLDEAGAAVDRIDVAKIPRRIEGRLELLRAQLLHHLGVGRQQGLERHALAPGPHGVPLHELVRGLAGQPLVGQLQEHAL